MATKIEKLQEKATKLELEFTEETTIVELEEMIEGADPKSGEAPKKEEKKEEKPSKAKKGTFNVYDGNGKHVRTAKTEEKAKKLAKVFQGRYKEV
ncbi:MAG TPA: hypothetical protein ENI76_07455 [Ignavibacteria bacterium]|nr:hypothetical protein [Ignavibacteria bacterium]